MEAFLAIPASLPLMPQNRPEQVTILLILFFCPLYLQCSVETYIKTIIESKLDTPILSIRNANINGYLIDNFVSLIERILSFVVIVRQGVHSDLVKRNLEKTTKTFKNVIKKEQKSNSRVFTLFFFLNCLRIIDKGSFEKIPTIH